MKRTVYIALFILISSQSFALNIRQIVVSRISDSAINISLDTEAKELYYFSSWDYEISENTIVIEARFVEGFGSTIAFLNNNFETYLLFLKLIFAKITLNVNAKITKFEKNE